MPSRTKPSTAETEAAIAASLREWGVQPSKDGIHATFANKITSIAITCLESDWYDSDEVALERMSKIPRDRDEAIVAVFESYLLEYQDESFRRLRANKVEDALKNVLTWRDDPTRIIGYAPYYLLQQEPYIQTRKKPAFQSFHQSALDPFQRFSALNEGLSTAELAYKDCSDEGWMNGYAFEAIVASHAVHNEACFCCHSRNSLVWYAGSELSWKDLVCQSCNSCFEIKSKKDLETIDRIFRYDKLHAGSFVRWCADSNDDRVKGTDYIVLVSRKPSYTKRDGWAWSVEIAEIGSVLPKVSANSIVSRCEDNKAFLKTVLSLRHRRNWLRIPVGNEEPDLKKLFRQAYEKVFPGDWDQVARDDGQRKSQTTARVEAVSRLETSKYHGTEAPSATLDDLALNLADLAVGGSDAEALEERVLAKSGRHKKKRSARNRY